MSANFTFSRTLLAAGAVVTSLLTLSIPPALAQDDPKAASTPAPKPAQTQETDTAVFDPTEITELLDQIELSVQGLEGKRPPLEGVILLIADGLSYELLTGARLYRGGTEAELHVETLPHTAIIRTHSAKQAVTDSAAAGTAIGRGYRTANGTLGQRPDGTSGPSLLDVARKAGWSTGVVTDDAIMGGTVAAFMIEAPDRFHYPLIGSKILDQLGPDQRLDLVMGGGAAAFDPKAAHLFPEEQREQLPKNAEKLANLENTTVIRSWQEFKEKAPGAETVLAMLRPDKLSYYGEGKRDLRLKEMAVGALGWLQAKNQPYLLIVEAALPDKASHQNQAKLALEEVFEFDDALKALIEKAGPNTLIIATTDHGTGGFVMNYYMPATMQGDAWFGTEPSEGRSIITWATGPGAEEKVNEFERFETDQKGKATYTSGVHPRDHAEFRHPAAEYADSASHTAGDVWAAATGPGSYAISGWLDNDDLFRIIGRAILVKPENP